MVLEMVNGLMGIKMGTLQLKEYKKVVLKVLQKVGGKMDKQHLKADTKMRLTIKG
ncbi:MAG: hypothetical protein ACPGLV_16625 [Bacteroidia bacterium]